jgi:hypothetical protein
MDCANLFQRFPMPYVVWLYLVDIGGIVHLLFTFYSSIQMNSPFSCYFLDLWISFPGLHLRMFYILRKEILVELSTNTA